MVKKLNQAKPEGLAQPKIETHSRWKDNYGDKITVKCVAFGRIAYVRDGYECECVCSEYRFRNDFIFLPEDTLVCQTAAKENSRKKIAELRSSLALDIESFKRGKGKK